MSFRCALCGNTAAGDFTDNAVYSCRVCGAELAAEKIIHSSYSIIERSCPICGNPSETKTGEIFKCAVCGGESKIPKTADVLKTVSDLSGERFAVMPKSAVQTRSINRVAETPKADITENQKTVKVEKLKESGNIAAHISPAKENAKHQTQQNTLKPFFTNIFVSPAPLGKQRTEPDIRIFLGKSSANAAEFNAPFFTDTDARKAGLAVFDALPYYENAQSASLKDSFLTFKSENEGKICGMRILPYQIEEDLEFLSNLGCGVAEIDFGFRLLSGVRTVDAHDAISKARGIINRRGYNLDLIARNSAHLAQDIIIALCLGADAVSLRENSPILGIDKNALIKDLKQYCTLCAHGKITEFERCDLIFK